MIDEWTASFLIKLFKRRVIDMKDILLIVFAVMLMVFLGLIVYGAFD